MADEAGRGPVTGDLGRLCAHFGIATGYFDAFGARREASAESLIALLAEFGVRLDGAADAGRALEAAHRARWAQALPPVRVVQAGSAAWSVSLRLPASMRRLRWQLGEEQGRELQGEADAEELPETGRIDIDGIWLCERVLPMPLALEAGYHRLRIEGLRGETLVLATPGRCYRPPAVRDGGRVWGAAVQLYSLRSPRNWGIGDFSDLEELAVRMAAQGADIIGLNPLHALFASTPSNASPYSPSSRQQLDVLYIDVEAVDGFADCDPARERVHSPDFQARLAALRATQLVDYAGVAAAKFEVLELLFGHFCARHLPPEGAPDEAGREFLAFVAERGEALRQHALFEALQAHFLAAEGGAWDWHAWPVAYRNPDSAEVTAFAVAHAQRVQFHQYLQWLATRQLARAAARCDALGMGVGLYVDLAVSVDRAGSDTWGAQEVFAEGASVGAPPDEFNPAGQGWGLPPLRPDRLRTDGYRFFIETLRAGMRGAGALRIDHVMGLMRLFWIPQGRGAREGAYVYYPLDEMLAIVAIESHRHRCMVVGEDLGTVEDTVRDALAQADVLSYRLLYFEKQRDGRFTQPAAYPPAALVAISTHDLATFAGWWTADDLRERLALGLFPDPAIFDKQLMDRAQERIELMQALQQAGLLLREEVAQAAGLAMPSARIVEAAHAFLAAAPSALMMVQLEDVAGVVAQANMPGTVDEHPNWRRKLPEPVAALAGGERMRGLGEALRAARPRQVESAGRSASPGLTTRVPRATYRLQFHKDFGFDDAIRVLPYLAKLGVSHVYCSPIQRARAGSMHGYDVVAHAEINPELGGEEGFARFVAALKANGLGQLLDMVPNHMGVFGADNAWWMDVLENGPASLFAQHFDIDWQPLNVELTGKVLLPVLGVHYGEALENGELILRFEDASGSFAIGYYDHRFPLAPESYPMVLERALARLGDAAASGRLASLSTAFGHLPGRGTASAQEQAERVRDKELLKARLARLAQRHPSVAQALVASVAELNLALPEARDALHKLIELQAYRLAHWRVAADEINYRRFFDINDLAAVRMEREEVFEATQSFALDLAASGVVDGLRIDHPDGLYDPAEYFRKLQEGYARRAGLVLPTHDAQGRPARPLYVVAEKIAGAHEEVPESWHVHGTTGYRFANVANGVLVDTAAEASVVHAWQRFTGEMEDFASVSRAGRREVMRNALASELNVLSTELLRIARAHRSTRDYTLNALRRALADVGACMPVYRTYIVERPSEQDARFIDEAVDEAARQSGDADRSIFDFVRCALRGEAVASASPALGERVRRFALRFQQFSAPVAAKGVEDTAFYRYFPLSSLNEVGGEPDLFGIEVDAFHAASADRALRWPHTMLATSTHDNKRSEDVRNRIDVLSEMPNEWVLALTRWHGLCRGTRKKLAGGEAPSRADEYLLYQTLLGTLPLGGLDAGTAPGYSGRIWQYMQKAAREAKLRTRWSQPDADYEAALERFVRELLADPEKGECLADIQRLADTLSWFGAWNSLTLTLLKYSSPGVPDLYQGSELIELSLVDPDNRRPVDYALRQRRLAALRAMVGQEGVGLASRVRSMVEAPHDGRAKLWFIWRLLSLRREQPLLFSEGSYEPLAVEGPLSRHVVAFARRHEDQVLVVVAGRLFVDLSRRSADEDAIPALPEATRWKGTTVCLPAGVRSVMLENLLTGESLSVGEGAIRLDDALRWMPWAVFSRTAPREKYA
ncbi:malto-oligosyltrehalose synthase [Variovorax sp. OV084]|jgi:(1->4)-alpha-D-glucan 1-alpha-D-glucosylmutase|uniref:malto-oligosyltrehalose synthase n=1 Tax=Variovorax sp. OV084 TaxID=1882777 RepID=UPI0008D2E6EF|nr:malto-oligosyltrehalose synthase [Variovorax sp. OV084]SEU12372.1 maltooligosyl trehalose synthase [Variovorax sp. OV084]